MAGFESLSSPELTCDAIPPGEALLFPELEAQELPGHYLRPPSKPRNYLRLAVLQQVKRLAVQDQRRKVTWKSTKAEPTELSHILNLPWDVLLLILPQLHILDVYHLSRTCKRLRNLLWDLGPRFWRSMLRRHSDFPRCPPSWNMLSWLDFMFGTGVCERCGGEGGQPDFGILRYYCYNCQEKAVISKDKAARMHKHGASYTPMDGTLQRCHQSLRIITSRGWQAQGLAEIEPRGPRPKAPPRYLLDDVYLVLPYQCKTCRDALLPDDSSDKLQQWEKGKGLLRRRLQDVVVDTQVGQAAYDWACRTLEGFQEVETNWYREKCRKGLRLAGYKDINDIRRYSHSINRYLRIEWQKGLSRKDFKYHFKRILRIMVPRHPEEIMTITYGYTVSKLTQDYMKRLQTSQWKHFPRPLVLWTFGPFEGINASETIPQLRARLRKWRLEVRAELYEQALSGTRSIFRVVRMIFDAPATELGELARTFAEAKVVLDDPKKLLDLAVTTFSCAQCTGAHHLGACLAGWDAILTHMCNQRMNLMSDATHQTMRWSDDAHTAATDLLNLVRLDPFTTTAAEMDALDYRYFCAYCDSVRPGFRKALTWRECLTHVVYDQVAAGHPWPPTWLLMTTRSSEHFITKPQRNRDIIYIPNRQRFYDIGFKYGRRKPVEYQVSPAWDSMCFLCDMGDKRLLKKEDVLKHIQKRHLISEPVEYIHWGGFTVCTG